MEYQVSGYFICPKNSIARAPFPQSLSRRQTADKEPENPDTKLSFH